MAKRGREADNRQRESNYIQRKTNLESLFLCKNHNKEAGNSLQTQPKKDETKNVKHLFPVVRTLPESPPDSSSEPYSPQQVNGEYLEWRCDLFCVPEHRQRPAMWEKVSR